MSQFNLTTAISYANGNPHIGHTLEFVIADIVARYQKIKGSDVWFLTGSDEHGQKIENTARKIGMEPIELCNKNVTTFKNLAEKLKIEYDRYIRTTETDHKKMVHKFFTLCQDDIELGMYRGWYNSREEKFVPDREAQKHNYVDPVTGKDLIYSREPTYLFRMDRYQGKIIDYIESHPNFIVPKVYQDDILSRLRNTDLKPLSISRTSIKWGINIPGDNNHVFYVWFDALINYISGGKWPANLHIIGKDIIWFHSVIWLSMLMSAGYELPEKIYVHGFVNDNDGQKMSKSVGNVVDPFSLLKKYPVDAIRYYLISRLNYGSDINFSESDIITSHDKELLEIYGNLANRIIGLCIKYNKAIIPEVISDEILDMDYIFDYTSSLVIDVRLQDYLNFIMGIVKYLNKYIDDTTPWTIQNKKYPDDIRTKEDRDIIVKTLIESIYTINHYMYPIIPESSEKLFNLLNVEKIILTKLGWNVLSSGHKITNKREVLFTFIDQDAYQDRKRRNVCK